MVVFEDGVASKADYRKFAVREQAGQDDFAAMAEVVSRRFARLAAGPNADEYDESFAATPNLVVIDGGKGQLAAALEAMAGLRPATRGGGLAREACRGGLPARSLRPGAAARSLARAPAASAPPRRGASLRDHVPPPAPRRGGTRVDVRPARGVGPARRRALLRHFGSAERVLSASAEELEGRPGRPGEDRAEHLRAAAPRRPGLSRNSTMSNRSRARKRRAVALGAVAPAPAVAGPAKQARPGASRAAPRPSGHPRRSSAAR